MFAQQVAELLRAERAVGQPAGQRVVPDQRVPTHALAVGLGEADQRVGARPVVLSTGRLEDVPLQLAFGRHAVELPGQDRPVSLAVGHAGRLRRRADGQAARAAAMPQTAAQGGRPLGETTVRCLGVSGRGRGRPAEQRDDDGRAGERDDDRRAGERPDRRPDGAQSHRHSH